MNVIGRLRDLVVRHGWLKVLAFVLALVTWLSIDAELRGHVLYSTIAPIVVESAPPAP